MVSAQYHAAAEAVTTFRCELPRSALHGRILRNIFAELTTIMRGADASSAT
jgi:hypothetical protein